MKLHKIFWGILLLAGAVLLLLDSADILNFNGLTPLNIIFGAILLGCFIQSALSISYPGMLFSLAFLCILFSKPFGLQAITPWPVLIAATLGSVGLSLLFPKKHKWEKQYGKYNSSVASKSTVKSEANGEYINFATSFGATVKYITSDNLKEVNASCKFGAMEIYFDNAIIQDESATLNLYSEFSGVEIYVPKEWDVENNVQATLGGMDCDRSAGMTGAKKLIINGEVKFGGVDVTFI